MSFTHLHLHTEYSLLDGACRIEQLMDEVQRLGQTSVAVTDHGVMYGVIDFYRAAKKRGIKPIIGCEVYMAARTRFDKVHALDSERYHLILLCENETGYKNLIKLVSEGFVTGFYTKPRIDRELLEKYHEGLIALSACLAGEIPRALLSGDYEGAKKKALWYRSVMGENNFFLEIQDHGLPEQRRIIPMLAQLSRETGIPLVATNDVHYISKEDAEMQQVLICIQTNHTLGEDTGMEFQTQEFYLKSEQEMLSLFPEYPDAVERPSEIAERCNVEFEFGKTKLPHFEVPGNQDHFEYLKNMAQEGMHLRYGENIPEEYQKRLDYELSVISRMGYVDYYLIVHDFINHARSRNIPVGPGRGSGAGSVCAYCLGITDIDPIRFNLLFERFLNPERVNMPDFDVDFCQDRRGETIDYVREKYGHERVAQIITFGKLQAKAVIRDVGRVLQMDFVADKLARLVPAKPGTTLAEAFSVEPEFDKQRKGDTRVEQLLDIAVKLEGLYRNASTHAAGVVVGQKPLNQIVPVYRDLSADSDLPVTQYNMKFVESTGLVKFDFLGLKTLTVIAEAVKMVQKRGIQLNISEISLDDRETYELLHQAETDGVFQLESGGMRKTLRDMQPDSLEDLIALVSLYRPGPMDNIPSYIARKHGKEQPDYMHPMLEGILKETYGIMIYQEQVMQIAQKMAGYTLGAADLLRRAMGKKKKEEMELQEAIFIEGATKNGIDPAKAKSIFARMAKFAEYGFNKSHAAAYALIAYQTAYLKAHYPVEFMAATMTYDMQNTDKLALYKKELGRLNIALLPPDINHSYVPFAVEDGAVRYALMAVKGSGEAPAKAVVAEREKNGPFKSMTDFIRRMDSSNLDKKSLETWIKAGTFDCLEKNRGLLHANLDLLMKHARAAGEEKNSAQINLFGQAVAEEVIPLTAAPAWTPDEKLKMESSVIGFYLSAHPLDRYGKSLERLRAMTYNETVRGVAKAGSLRAKMAVTVTSVRERMSKKGSKYAFVSASDTSGSFEFTVFSEGLSHYRDILKSDRPLLITVNAEKEEGSDDPRMILQHAEILDDVISQTAGGIMIVIDRAEAVEPLKNTIGDLRPGRSRVLFAVLADKWEVEIVCEKTYALTADVLSALPKIQGVSEVREL